MKIVQAELAALFVVLLGGCAGQTITDLVSYERTGIPSIFRYAAADRDLRTEIYGNPTTAPKETFDASVIAVMQRRNRGARTNFTTAPSESAREEYRVVMVFSGDRDIGGKAACREIDSNVLSTTVDRVELQAAFCFRDTALSHVHVGVGGFRDVNDPRLDAAVAQAVIHLFPLRDPYIEPEHDGEFKSP